MRVCKKDTCLITGWTFSNNSNYLDIMKTIFTRNPNYGVNGDFSDPKNLNELDQSKIKWYHETVEKEQKMRKAIVEELRARGYHFSGEYHIQGEFGAPIFNTTMVYCCSPIEWGGFMAEAFPDENYEGLGEDGRYLKWTIDDEHTIRETVLPNPDDEIYKKRTEYWKNLPYTKVGEVE